MIPSLIGLAEIWAEQSPLEAGEGGKNAKEEEVEEDESHQEAEGQWQMPEELALEEGAAAVPLASKEEERDRLCWAEKKEPFAWRPEEQRLRVFGQNGNACVRHNVTCLLSGSATNDTQNINTRLGRTVARAHLSAVRSIIAI